MAKKKKPVPDEEVGTKEGKPNKFDDTPRGQAERWGVEFSQAHEFHRKWREQGKTAVSKYLNRDMKTSDPQAPGYNLALFASSVNTMMSMLYGRVPQVSVDRRWADPKDQVARVAAELAERCLNADIEESGYDFSAVLRACLQDRLIPGIGIARVRYNFDEAEDTTEDVDEKTSYKNDEWIEDEYVPWEDVYWSPCRYWKEMRWLSFRLYKTKEEVIKIIGGDEAEAKKMVESIPFNSKMPLEDATHRTSETWDKAEVWEIWDKVNRKVIWWVDGYVKTLKEVEDPLELEGFFPAPPFFIANATTKEFVPKSDYSFASSLYREIDRLEERIALLTMAIKVVGVYDKKAGQDIGRLVNETAENKLIPVDSWAAFQERGGIKGSIEFLPIEEVAKVIEILQAQQGARIDQLFQVTGMSDIMRGQQQGDGRVSATADQIKVKFSSVRLQSIQDEFTQFATNMQKLRFEIICKHFDAETIIKHANLSNTEDAGLAMQAAELLKDTETVKWRIQIQPESMAMIDYAQLKQERTEYINSLGIFLQSSFPIAEKFPQSAPILMELLKWGLAGFKGSKEIEGVIDRAMAAMEQSANGPPPPDPEAQKAQAQIQIMQEKHQADMQKIQAETQQRTTEQAQQHELKMKELQADFTAKMATLRAELHQTNVETAAHHQKTQADMAARNNDARATVTENLTQIPQVPVTPAPPETTVGGQTI